MTGERIKQITINLLLVIVSLTLFFALGEIFFKAFFPELERDNEGFPNYLQPSASCKALQFSSRRARPTLARLGSACLRARQFGSIQGRIVIALGEFSPETIRLTATPGGGTFADRERVG